MNTLTESLFPNTLRVFAFTDDEGCMAVKKAGGRIGDQDVMVISNGVLHALVGQEPVSWPWDDADRLKVQRLMHYHRVLGAVTVLGKVIPASFDSVFQHASSIHQALAHHQRDILDLLGRYGTSRQFSLVVRWDSAAMQKLMQHFPKTNTQSAIETERRNLRDQILLQLQRYLHDIIILENNNNDVVLQAILLIETHQEERVVSALQHMDKECRGRLDMRLTGPLPACNFARVEVKLPDMNVVKQACRDLGIRPVTRLTEIKNAYRTRVKNLHPDNNNAGSSDVMVRLTQSYRYLTRLAAQQNNGDQNNPEKQWLHCDHKTLRKTPLMRIQRGVTRWDDAILKRA